MRIANHGGKGAGNVSVLRGGGCFFERAERVFTRELFVLLAREVQNAFTAVFTAVGALVPKLIC
jgi:hypothetical protein